MCNISLLYYHGDFSFCKLNLKNWYATLKRSTLLAYNIHSRDRLQTADSSVFSVTSQIADSDGISPQHLRLHVHMCVCVYMRTCICACSYVYICACMLRMCVCTYVCMNIMACTQQLFEDQLACKCLNAFLVAELKRLIY